MTKESVSKKRLFCAVIAAVMMIALGSFFQDHLKKEIVVAVIIRGKVAEFDQLHLHFIDKYLRERNPQMINHRFEHRIFSSDGNPHNLLRVYEMIIADPNIAVVIDNSWASELSAAAPLIAESGIPVISLTSDRGSVDYGGNVVFIGSDDNVPIRVSTFVQEVLRVPRLLFVAEDDYALTGTFETEMRASGLGFDRVMVRQTSMSEDERDTTKTRISQSLTGLITSGEKPVVVLNVHSKWGNELIAFIDKHFDGVTIVGGAYVSSKATSPVGSKSLVSRNNRLILLTYPADTASSKIAKDFAEMPDSIRDNVSSLTQPELFIKRCFDAVSIIGFAANESSAAISGRRISRSRIRDVFHANLVSAGFSDALGTYRFDERMILVDDRRFELHHRGHAETYAVQTNESREVLQNVAVGFRLLNVSNIDLRNRTFEAEFNYWIRFDRRFPDPTERIVFSNARTRLEQELPRSSDNSGEQQIRRFKSSGVFSFDPDVSRFPFDTHQLRIAVELGGVRRNSMISFDQRGLSEDRKRVANLPISGWVVNSYLPTIDKINGRPLGAIDEEELSGSEGDRQLVLSVGIGRIWPGPFIPMIIPLLSIGIVAVGLLFISNRSFAHVGEVSAGLLFAVVTFAIGFDDMMPRFATVTAADLWFFVTFLVILLVMLKAIVFNSRILPKWICEWEATAFSRIGVAFAIAYGTAMLLIAIWALWP